MYIWKSSVFWENTIVRRFCIRSTPLIDFLLPGGVPHQHGKEVRKRGSFGVVSWVSLLARFALLLIFDQDDVSRCQQVRPIVPRLFLTRKSARNDPPHASDISDFRRLSFSLALSFFSRDEVIDIFHEKNRRIYVYVNTLAAIGLSKGENFRSSYWFFVFFLLVLYFCFEGIDDWWSLKRDDVCVMSWFWKLLVLYREKVCQNFII